MAGEWVPKRGETVQIGTTLAVVNEVYVNSKRDGHSFYVDLSEYPKRLRKTKFGKKMRGRSAEEVVARKMMGMEDKPRHWRVPLSNITRLEGQDGNAGKG